MNDNPSVDRGGPTEVFQSNQEAQLRQKKILDAQNRVIACLLELEFKQQGNTFAWLLSNALINVSLFVTLASLRDTANQAALVGVIAAGTYFFQLINSEGMKPWLLEKYSPREMTDFYHALRTYCRVILLSSTTQNSEKIAYEIEKHLRKQPIKYSVSFWEELYQSQNPLDLILKEYILISNISAGKK